MIPQTIRLIRPYYTGLGICTAAYMAPDTVQEKRRGVCVCVFDSRERRRC
ncbi:predicted protein [Plenodomus lingam JN3]|uniref:Predicted protein n=1 Tax=Leptosphaeria maculans (strain JN3 / isolate v23.1.3 / race Av1-4-5-6-7-8) TaxID=985895 RepID=E5R5F2_LEPMJ|nr:predicted protein [Plenodomus lingam JN3]CBX92122.1 predicted protein [Plenodomus lingam JN3]